MNSALLVAPNRDVRLLVDLGERRVESLLVVVVESAWTAIVLSRDHYELVDVICVSEAQILTLPLVKADTRGVTVSLLPGHGRLLARLDANRHLALVSRMLTPVGSVGFRLSPPVRVCLLASRK